MKRHKINMFKKIILLIVVLGLIALPASAVQLQVDSANAGHFSILNVLGADDTAIVGPTATIDLSSLYQADTSGAVEVLELSQSDVDQPFLKFTCTEGNMNCNSTYTSTNATKTGAILVDINGTDRWIQTFDDPN